MLDGYIPPILMLIWASLLLFLRWYFFTRKKREVPIWIDICIIALVITLAAILEFAMGREPKYKYGPIRLWSSQVQSDQNSQQIADAYTFSHIIHGFIFYTIFSLFRKKLSLGTRATLAVAFEAAWEVLENTNMVINHYRAATISLNYYGDSIINSMSDIFACVAGFFLAHRLPLWVTVAAAIIMELTVLYFIRDNLTLNIIMLIYPLQAIRTWQMGG
jgi:hypothetical protein